MSKIATQITKLETALTAAQASIVGIEAPPGASEAACGGGRLI